MMIFMTNNNSATLGNIGKVVDLSHMYATGSYQVKVSFEMFGLSFEATRFVRTDSHNLGGATIDNVELYTKHESSWCSDFLKMVDRANPCPASRRALALLAVAQCDVPADVSERFAQIELA